MRGREWLLLLELARSGLTGDASWPVTADRETVKRARELLTGLHNLMGMWE